MAVTIAIAKVLGIIIACILGVLLILLVILLLTRIDLLVRYSEQGLIVKSGAWGINLRIYPPRRKKRPRKDKKKAKSATENVAEKAEAEERGGSISGFFIYLDPAVDALKGVFRSFFVKKLRVRFIAAKKDDPASAALQYGTAWSVTGALTPSLEKSRNVLSYSFDIGVDYDADDPLLYFLIVLRAPVWRFVIVGIRFLLKANKIRKEKRN